VIAVAAFAILQVAKLSGELPSQVEPAAVTRVVWVPADESAAIPQGDCVLLAPRGWSCHQRSAGDVGVVLIQAGAEIGFVAFGGHGVVASGIAKWGRVIRVTTAGDPEEVSAMALRLDRPAIRPNTRTLGVVPDTETHIWPMSSTAFWVAGTSRRADAFIRFEAKQSARHDEPLERVLEDEAESPLTIPLQPPLMLEGHVESSSGAAVSGAIVDVLTLRPSDSAEPTRALLNTVDVMYVAETRTDADGRFEFEGLESRLYNVAVIDFEHGRGDQWTDAVGQPIVIRLKAPAKATGRVLRQSLPVPGVVVRFVPDASAWRDSRDPAAHLALDASTDDSGRFMLTLPPSAEGAVQLTAPDGATKRIPVPHIANVSEVALGDVVLEELIEVELQTDVLGCVVSAVGPAGVAGFSIVRARSVGIVHSLQLPEPGQWLMQVECGGVQRRVSPPMVEVSAKGELSTHSLRVLD